MFVEIPGNFGRVYECWSRIFLHKTSKEASQEFAFLGRVGRYGGYMTYDEKYINNNRANYLECVLLVNDLQIEAYALLQRHLALALLVAPLVVDQRVADNRLEETSTIPVFRLSD